MLVRFFGIAAGPQSISRSSQSSTPQVARGSTRSRIRLGPSSLTARMDCYDLHLVPHSVLCSFTSFHDPYKNSVIAGERASEADTDCAGLSEVRLDLGTRTADRRFATTLSRDYVRQSPRSGMSQELLTSVLLSRKGGRSKIVGSLLEELRQVI